MGLTAIVLGAAAGGGFPQWNCLCPVCLLGWARDRRALPRTQAGLAVSGDGENWVLLNAAPDLRGQILATAQLHPRVSFGKVARDSPIQCVVLTGAEIDQTAGLLSLRERSPFTIVATPATLATFADNPMFTVLDPELVPRRALVPGERVAIGAGLELELFPVPGKVPLYLEGKDAGRESDGMNVGVDLWAGEARLAYVPGAANVTPAMKARLRRTDVVLFDGTLYTDDEMIRTGTGTKSGRRMGHMPIEGPDGSLAALADLPGRRIFIHINNTNPILIEGSQERARVEAAGWIVGEDGMEIVL